MLLPLHLNLVPPGFYGGGGNKGDARLVYAWMRLPKRAKRDDVIPAVVETIEAVANSSAIVLTAPIGEIAEKIVEISPISRVRQIDDLFAAIDLIERAMAELDDEEALMLVL